MRFLILIAVLCSGLISTQSVPADEKENAILATQARNILKKRCWRCHSGDQTNDASFDVLNSADLIGSGRIEKGHPEDSYLFELIVKNRMPPRAVQERVTAKEGDIIRRWIQTGATAFPQPQKREFFSLEAILTSVRNHQKQANANDRPYLRYFTLHNLYNNPNFYIGELDLYRAALSKTVNSLSWKKRLKVPVAVDDKRLIYAIDMRDYGWSRTNQQPDKWEEVLKLYPYGLSYRNLPNESLAELNDEIVDMASFTDLPLIRADWFITTATRPPLYHTILEIPHTGAELEMRVGVNIRENFQHPKASVIARAGFAKSRVSGQNRLVERHDSLHGALWKSYDFLPDRYRAKLTRFPLGPLNLFSQNQHPFPNQAFVHDGGEIIGNLPNGLQVYMLVDGDDKRIDEGPVSVVSDSLKTSGTPAIVNGVSCISCHRMGMIRFKDSVREHSAVFGDAEKLVRRLYPAQEKMDELLQEDEDRFTLALEKTVGPFLLKQGDYETELKDTIEPVGEVARAHRLSFLDLKTIACELEIEDPQQLIEQVGAKRLKKLGLEALLQDGGVISRLEWESTEGVSLMQELARELRYTPYRSF